MSAKAKKIEKMEICWGEYLLKFHKAGVNDQSLLWALFGIEFEVFESSIWELRDKDHQY